MASSSAPAPPSHKLIPGCGFLVDGFQTRYAAHPSVKAYFLTHAHSDHYNGLRDDWSRGVIYCSHVTARLIAHMLGVGRRWLHPLPLDSPTMIQGVEVTLVSANHCPGAVQFLFRLPDGRRFIHTGDMRFSPALLANPHLQQFRGCDALFLDTTYCNPRYCFPPQEESIEYVASTIQRLLQEDAEQQQQESQGEGREPGARQRRPFRRLYLISTYGIGKERILTAVHDRCGVRLHVADRKHAVMQQLDLPGYDPSQLFTTDRGSTPVHVVQWGFLGETWPYFRPNFVSQEALRQELGAEEVVGFVPTGWLYEMRKETFAVKRKGACSVHLVPYSEHNSFDELREYVRFLRPLQVVPTVGVEGEDGDKARDRMLKHFRLLVDETASKAKFLQAFHRSSANGATAAGTVDTAVPEQAPQHDCPDGEQEVWEEEEQAAQQEEVIDLVEEEDEEIETDGSGGGIGSGTGAVQAGESPQALAGLAAAGDDPAAAAAAVPAIASPAAAPVASPPAEEGGEGPSDPLLHQLLSVLGEEVSKQQGRQLLVAAGGDLQGAVNGYYDGLATAAAAGSGRGKDAATVASPAPSTAADSSRGGGGGAGGGIKRPAPTPATKPKGKKQKGRAAVAASPGQRNITSFFTKQQGPPQGQRQQQEPQEQQQDSGGAAAVAAADAAAGGDLLADDEDLALTLNVPLAASPSAAAAAAAAAGQAAAGVSEVEPDALAAPSGKPKLVLPPPPSPGSAAAASAKGAAGGSFFLSGRGAGGQTGSGGGGSREAAVPRDALALPLERYDPVAHACWEPGEPTPYLHLARAFEAMHSTTKRLRISDVLVNCFRSVLALRPAEELVQTAYLATGRIAPDYEDGTELRVGGSIMTAAIVEATGVSKARLHDMYKDMGDAGDVFQALRHNQAVLQRPAPLTVPGVFAALQQIAQEKGEGSQKRRQRLVLSLLRACREQEPRFVARTLVQNLRVGANWRSVVPALAKAVVLHKEGGRVAKARLDQAAAAATTAFHVCPDLRLLCDAMLAHPTEEWEQRCLLTPGMPVKPMLAKICEGLEDAVQQMKDAPFLAEFKYDGMRAQIHVIEGGQVRIFSRSCEDQTPRWPDAVQQILEAMQGGATTTIIDAELVAVDPSDGNRLRAFQELASRKKAAELAEVSVHVCIFAFDLLHRDGASLMHLPLEQRREQLLLALPNMRPGRCALAQSVRFPEAGAATSPLAAGSSVQLPGPGDQHEEAGGSADDTRGGTLMEIEGRIGAHGQEAAPLEERLQEMLLQAFAAGAEGLMLKKLAAAYEPSKRSDHWIKVKKDYVVGLHDTLDLVVIGAWHGNGRKAGWFSPYLLACYDPDTEQLQSVCRCMSGFTDAFYRESKERLSQTIIPGHKPYYNTGEQPDMWFEPREVWEIRGADLSLSPVHKAAEGLVHAERGLGLRFPRFLGRVRQDKSPEDATSSQQIAEMYRAQTRKVETAGQRLAADKQLQLPQEQAAGPESYAGSGGEEEEDGADIDAEEYHHSS